jgi:hypothetical protein
MDNSEQPAAVTSHSFMGGEMAQPADVQETSGSFPAQLAGLAQQLSFFNHFLETKHEQVIQILMNLGELSGDVRRNMATQEMIQSWQAESARKEALLREHFARKKEVLRADSANREKALRDEFAKREKDLNIQLRSHEALTDEHDDIVDQQLATIDDLENKNALLQAQLTERAATIDALHETIKALKGTIAVLQGKTESSVTNTIAQ